MDAFVPVILSRSLLVRKSVPPVVTVVVLPVSRLPTGSYLYQRSCIESTFQINFPHG